MLVVGGGNSAVESALSLCEHGRCASVSSSYGGEVFARFRGENRDRIEQPWRRVACARCSASRSPASTDRVPSCDGSGAERELDDDAIIVQVGGTPPSALLEGFGIELVTKYGKA